MGKLIPHRCGLNFRKDVAVAHRNGADHAAGFDVVEDECFQWICRKIQRHMQANATHSLFLVSPLNCNSDNGFTFGTAASFAGFLAAYEKFIHFYTPGESFTILANGAAAQLLKPAFGSEKRLSNSISFSGKSSVIVKSAITASFFELLRLL